MLTKDLEESRVFYYFKEISKIPRCTYNEEGISNYLKEIGENLGLETIQDENLNIIIRKPASEGYEDSQGVIIQGHMDMVCEKVDGCEHDFLNDPIELKQEGDFIIANDTTLGADNGIAVAMGLAIMEDENLEHPNLELLITSSEEVGMDGAIGLSEDVLKGSRMLNIDTEEEGTLVLGSAGGELIDLELDLSWEEGDYKEFKLEVAGLKGGHSGLEIDRELGNSNKILNEIISKLKENHNLRIIALEGGTKDNAIPRSSFAKFAIDSNLEELKSNFKNIKEEILVKYSKEDKLEISLKELGRVDKVLSEENTKDIIYLIENVHTGPYIWLKEGEIVESSSNLAIIKIDDKFRLSVSCRSSSKKSKNLLRKDIIDKIEKVNGKYSIGNSYPEWEYDPDSLLKDIAMETYKDFSGEEMKSSVIHAGLECGVIKEKYPDMEIVSFGPNIYNAHLPSEKLSISSTERTFEYLKRLLTNLK